ncbi:hypothetical protein KNHN1_55440 (plasmid) [Pseudomonas guariconensis]
MHNRRRDEQKLKPSLQNEVRHNEQRENRFRHNEQRKKRFSHMECRRQNEIDGATGRRENE